MRSLSGTFSGRRIAQCAPAAPVKLDLELLERVASDPDTQAGQFLSAAHCGDDATVMIVLRADVGSVDVLHMVLTPSTSDHALDMLTRLAPALTTAWSMRHPGFSKALLAAQRRTTRRQDMAPDAPILCVDNSYGLSRSEFRVCRLLETGLRPREIADELGLSIATIRTHLGNIYAKTELSGQLAVVSHLNGHRTVDAHAA
ncbi:MAG: helix-turn-helix transcriptional regulator [Roseovarius sp.]